MSSLLKLSQFLFYCNKTEEPLTKNKTSIHKENISLEKIVITDNPFERIAKVANEFGITKDKLHYKIIKEGSKGFFGFGSRPYHILFYYFGSTHLLQCQLKKNIWSKKYSKSIRNNVEFKIKRSGVFIRLNKEADGSLSFSLDKLVSFLSIKGLEYSFTNLKDIFARRSDDWERIANYQGDQNDDSKVMIDVSDDRAKAYLFITSPIKLGALPEWSDVDNELNAKNICYGVKKDIIKWMLETPILNRSICIAEGIPITLTIQPKIRFFFTQKKTKIQIYPRHNGKVDFFGNIGFVDNVVKDMVLAEKIPGCLGKVGLAVDNRAIQPEPIKEVIFQPGQNAVFSADNNSIIASSAGRPFYNDDEIGVKSCLCIEDDVSLETGSIVFLGDVIIRGSVEDGLSVKADGNVYVAKYVGKSTIESQGDIVIKGGFLGCGKGEIRAASNVITRFINKGKVRARGEVVAYDGAFYSDIQSDSLFVLGPRGKIVGGSIRCRREINAQIIGSSTYTSTKIEVGYDPLVKQKLSELKNIHRNLENDYKKVILNIKTIEKKTRYKNIVGEKNKKLYQRIQSYQTDLKEQIELISTDIQQIRSYLSSCDIKQVRIAAKKIIYPGTDIRIQKNQFVINKELTFVCFYRKLNSIQAMSYIEPEKSVLVCK